MLYRSTVRDAFVVALKAAATMAAQAVFAPQDVPTPDGPGVTILVHMPLEVKESLGKGGVPRFNTTATIGVVGRVQGTDQNQVEAQAEQLCEQIQQAILGGAVVRLVEEFTRVESQLQLSANGDYQLGEAQVAFAVRFFEAFAPAPGVPLSIAGVVTSPAEIDIAFNAVAAPPMPAPTTP